MEKKFNYFYGSVPVTKEQFEMNVEKDWREKTDEYGTYSYGLYTAFERDND